MTTEATPRPVQVKCKECNHPKSFHGGGITRCRALGCVCEEWMAPEEETLPV